MLKKSLLLFSVSIFLISFASSLFVDNGSLIQYFDDCGEFNTTGATYILNQSISATDSCLVIFADGITVNGSGFSIVGQDPEVAIYGINISSTNSDSYTPNITLNNFSITNFGTDIYANGKSASNHGYDGATIYLNNITAGNLYSVGGTCTNAFCSAGTGGTLYIYNSNITNVYAYGGLANSGGGGTGGNVTAYNTTNTLIEAQGRTSRIGGSGGFVYLYNTTTETVRANAGTSQGTDENGNNGGNVTCILSVPTYTSSFGGNARLGGNAINTGGNGGDIYIQNGTINKSALVFDLGFGKAGGTNGTAGRLILNYTSSFSDQNSLYNNTFKFKVIRESFGEINWFGETPLGNLGNLSENLNISFNFVYLNSSAIPDLNFSANITLYGLDTNMTSPVIYKDGVECTDCFNFTSLNAGTVIFNISSFSNYTVRDSYISPLVISDESSGGGGSSSGYFLTKKQLVEGINLTLRENNRVRFKIENETFILTFSDLDYQGKRASFSFIEFGQEKTLFIGDRWDLFLNNVESQEIAITLYNLSSQTAKISIIKVPLSTSVGVVNETNNSILNPPQPTVPPFSNVSLRNVNLILFIVLIVLASFLLYYFLKFHVHKKKQKK